MESFNYISDDEKQHLIDLPTSWQPGDFHKKWKICPLFASMWMRLFSKVSDASTTASGSNSRVTSFQFVQYLRAAEKKKLSLGTLASSSVHVHGKRGVG
jgi:hypothetical protein